VPFEAPCFAGTIVEHATPPHTACVLERPVSERGITCRAAARADDRMAGAFGRHPNGSIAACVLAAPAELAGVALPAGTIVTFAAEGQPLENGRPQRSTVVYHLQLGR
jgi:hypothetical protein